MKISKEVRKRFKNISVPHITHMDTLESALVVSSELGNKKNFEYIQSLINVENSIKDNPLVIQCGKMADEIKDHFPSLIPIIENMENMQKNVIRGTKSRGTIYSNDNKLLHSHRE